MSGTIRVLTGVLACGLAVTANLAHAALLDITSGGLRQLVHEWETSDPRLRAHLALHIHDAAGTPLMQFKLADGASLQQMLPKMQALGFRLVAVSSTDPSRIEGYLPLAKARAASGLAGVVSIKAEQRPHTNAGSVQSQAVALQKANLVQALGFDGSGIKVGVLSDSYNACADCSTDAAADIASGDLPSSPITVLEDLGPGDGGEDEGRAMMQLIHDVAPGAQLAFATAFTGEVQFANNIIALREIYHADVIVDDVGYLDEPFYSDGVIAQAVDKVVREGAAYYSSAGNNGMQGYELTYSPVPYSAAVKLAAKSGSNVKLDQIPAAIRPKSVHLFLPNGRGPGRNGEAGITQRITTATANDISFQWDEPFGLGKVKTDYNVYIFDTNGNWMDPSSPDFPGFYTTDDNTVTDEAFEYIYLPPFTGDTQSGGINASDYQIVIGKVNDGPATHLKYVVDNGNAESQREGAPTIYGHAAARGAQAVAATYYAIPNFPEDFSSPGPVTIYRDNKGNRLLIPEIRNVPQITAADGVDTTFFGYDADANGLPNFFGTSAAAPDAAAVAAIALQAAGGPGSVPPQALYGVLQATATRMPVPTDRLSSGAIAGPLTFTAQGNWTRFKNYFGLTLDPILAAGKAVRSISINLTNNDVGLVWSANPTRFFIGDSAGVAQSDVTTSVSADGKTFTLNFKPKSFMAGEWFRFGMSVFTPSEGSTIEAPDRLRNAKVTVLMEDGTSYSGIVVAAPKLIVNNFTGAGLVNAQAAVKAAQALKGSH